MLHTIELYNIKTYDTDTNEYILNDVKDWMTEISAYLTSLALFHLQSKPSSRRFSKSGSDLL